ncbi:uncharacterized protein LOC110931363 [Helianthus annuus]|uniref:uncharacterized protein LOC110931363 n=1 Tax=Helianthus annuus TaxID=4232 RepID=UPI000B8FAB5A|nr:uncharacterized protein LOC110931363 [Helianthus annuus]
MENYDKMIYGKPSDYVTWEPSKFKNDQPTDFKKTMNFVKNENENCSNESADKSEHVNETETKTETETETKTEPVKTSIEEIEESSLNSDSVNNTNCSSSCAESVRTEEKSKEDDESHQCVANNVISDKNDLYAWNYVFLGLLRLRVFPLKTKTDESGAVILDYGCDKNGYVENVEDVLTGEPDVSTDELESSISSDSQINSDDSGKCSGTPETSETPNKDEKLDVFYYDNEEIVEQWSSDEPDNQTEDSGTSDNEHKSSKDSDCDEQSESSSIATKESQTVLDIDCSSSDKPESSNVKDSEVDKAEEDISIESNSVEVHGTRRL